MLLASKIKDSPPQPIKKLSSSEITGYILHFLWLQKPEFLSSVIQDMWEEYLLQCKILEKENKEEKEFSPHFVQYLSPIPLIFSFALS